MEMKPKDEGKDEIVVTISHLSVEEQQDQPETKQTSVPKANATKPRRKTKGRLVSSHDARGSPCPFVGRWQLLKFEVLTFN